MQRQFKDLLDPGTPMSTLPPAAVSAAAGRTRRPLPMMANVSRRSWMANSTTVGAREAIVLDLFSLYLHQALQLFARLIASRESWVQPG